MRGTTTAYAALRGRSIAKPPTNPISTTIVSKPPIADRTSRGIDTERPATPRSRRSVTLDAHDDPYLRRDVLAHPPRVWSWCSAPTKVVSPQGEVVLTPQRCRAGGGAGYEPSSPIAATARLPKRHHQTARSS